MKQGKASNTSPEKHTPTRSTKASPGAVSNIGNMVGQARAVKPIDIGKGPTYGGGANKVHRAGTQGKH